MLVIAIIMPTIVADIGGADYYTWTAMLYTIGAIVGGASTGTVWARLGARRGYVLGALVFALGTVCCALAPGIGALIAARTVQGWAGGLVAGSGMALITSLYSAQAAHPHHRRVAGHVHRLPPERPGGRRHVRGDELVARLVLGDGAVHAGLRRHRLCAHSRRDRQRDDAGALDRGGCRRCRCCDWRAFRPGYAASPPPGRPTGLPLRLVADRRRDRPDRRSRSGSTGAPPTTCSRSGRCR